MIENVPSIYPEYMTLWIVWIISFFISYFLIRKGYDCGFCLLERSGGAWTAGKRRLALLWSLCGPITLFVILMLLGAVLIAYICDNDEPVKW